MKKPPFITINSELGLLLGLSSETWADAFCYDLRPKCIAFVRMSPKEINKENTIYEFFRAASKIYSVVEIWNPTEDIAKWAIKWNYAKKIDPAGCVYYTDEAIKISSRE